MGDDPGEDGSSGSSSSSSNAYDGADAGGGEHVGVEKRLADQP